MGADLEVVERLVAAAAGLGAAPADSRRGHELAAPLQERGPGLVPRRLTDEQFDELVAWARSLPGAFERRRRLLHATPVNVRGGDRLPPRAETTLRRLRRTIRDVALPPTTSEL